MTTDQYPLLIFDWDGTLMDSISHIVDSLQHAMHVTGVEVLSRAQSGDIIGLGMREAIVALFPNYAQDEKFIGQFTESYQRYYLEHSTATHLFEGAEETLISLKNIGYTLAIATGKGRKGLDHVLAQTGLAPLFAASRCASETQSKPHPEMINTVLDDTGFGHEQAIMIGDTEYDLQMATNAGVISIGASYGVHTSERLKQHNPKAIIQQITELTNLLA
ncbi:Similar to phosphoglycolate phosphatase, clustered with ribosomal large subunit pseudouridine synthase C [hydrothermal vent metagenome]|uniref:Similar to phosphoglycolate phosphatase, clustered with ribosomal large subunit pseudouridine synthase C n=1 Tax=hydrothermal vent metagenome TaxID=652676 RepID=A0A3B0YQL9_9ZZZZ